MKKAITQFFGFEYDWKKRVEDIKKAGFDSCMTSADTDFEEQNGTLEEQVQYFEKVGLEADTLHSSYFTPDLPYFWQEGEKGEEILNLLKDELMQTKKYSFKAMVVHILGEPSTIGLNRMKELVKLAEQEKVIIALENVENPIILDYVFENIKSDYLKFCFDSGHENFSKIQRGVLEKYLDKLICFHLHDNDSNSDQHTLNKYGTIDWENIAKILSKKKGIENLTLSYELLLRYRENETAQDVLNETFKQAEELESLILKYKEK